jgi:hypothetical protein
MTHIIVLIYRLNWFLGSVKKTLIKTPVNKYLLTFLESCPKVTVVCNTEHANIAEFVIDKFARQPSGRLFSCYGFYSGRGMKAPSEKFITNNITTYTGGRSNSFVPGMFKELNFNDESDVDRRLARRGDESCNRRKRAT